MKKSTALPKRIFPAAITAIAAVIFLNTAAFAQGGQGGQGQGTVGPMWSPVGTTGVETSREVFIYNNAAISKTLTAKLLLCNDLQTLGLAQLDALLVNGTSTFNGNITLGNGVSILHAVSSGSFSFNNQAGDNILGLGYNLNNPATQQGILIAPTGFKGNANGSILLGDANFNGQILLALGTGSSGTRINMDGAGKRIVLQNDGGDKATMGGVNAPTLWETTQGVNIAKRSGFTFTGTHILSAQGSINAENYYLNGNLIDVPKIGSDIAELQTTVDSLKQNPGSQWTTNGNDIYYQDENLATPGNVGIGTSTPPERFSVNGNIAASGSVFANGGFHTTGTITSGSITTGNLTISDKISTKSAEIERSVVSDTLHALKSLEVNNSLRLSRDTTVMYAEMSTKDTAVALMLQKEPSAPVVIGDAPTPPPGESRPKLTVSGNSLMNGNLNVSGSITASMIGNEGTSIIANCVSTSCINVSGQTSFNNIQVATNVKTNRIIPLDGDSLIHLGNNSVIINDSWNNLFGSNTNNQYFGNISGIGLGDFPIAKATSSVALGTFTMVESNATGAVVIGQGIGFPNPQFLNNNIPNSLMIGFGSNIPTVFVGASNGAGTTGNVGIGTVSPYKKLTVNGDVSFANYNNSGSGNQGNGFSGLEILGMDQVPTRRGISLDPDPDGSFNFYINSNQNNAGFNFKNGVGTPTTLMSINSVGDASIKGQLTVNGHDLVLGNNDSRPQGNKLGQRALVHDGWQQGKDDLVINYDGDFEDGVLVGGPKLLVDGNVGIGTDNPHARLHVMGQAIIGSQNIISGSHINYKLAVDGKLVAREFYTISSGWGDHVFENNYDLWTLGKVDEYLEKNGHLNGFPNAEYFKKNGMNLSEVAILQQIKIEEIFLYLIQQNKKIDELQLKIKTLEEESK